MSWPNTVSLITGTVGDSLGSSGQSADRIYVAVTPVFGEGVHRLLHAATGTVWDDRAVVTSGTPGLFVQVPHVDQTGFVDGQGNAVTDWYYLVQVITRAGTGKSQWSYYWQPRVADGDTVDLDTLGDGVLVTDPILVYTPAQDAADAREAAAQALASAEEAEGSVTAAAGYAEAAAGSASAAASSAGSAATSVTDALAAASDAESFANTADDALAALEAGIAAGDFTGATGPQGPTGPTGPTGPSGPTGPTGPAGSDAAVTDAAVADKVTTGTATKTALSNAFAGSLTTTAVKTGAYSASAGDLIPVDASAGTVTVTLPTAPTARTRVAVKKIDASTNTVTVQRGGASDVFNKAGGATSVSLALTNQAVNLQYSGGIWYVVSDDLPLSGLDTRFVGDQVDFVELVQANAARYSTFRVSKPQANNYQVRLSDGSSKGVLYAFVKDTDDDFVKLGACYAGFGTNTRDAHVAVAGDLTGTWNTASSSWYTTTVGGTATATVKGSTVSIYIIRETRGGLWNYTVKDGATTVASGTVSCWASSTSASTKVDLATGLTAETNHTILLTYAGDDPAHSPSSNPSRGYLRNDVWGAFVGSVADASETNAVLHGTSNKEMAWSTQATLPEAVVGWIPEHNNTASAFQIDAPVFYDDRTVIDPAALAIGAYVDTLTRFRLVQHFYGRIGGSNVAEVWTTHTIEKDGVLTFSGRLQALATITGMTGYPLMLPGATGMTEFITGILNTQLALGDSSYTYFAAERDAVSSGAVIASGSPDLIGAGTLLNARLSYRRGKTAGKPTPGQDLFVWHRPTPPKMYWQSMYGRPMVAGDAFAWSFKLAVANITNIYGMAKG